MDELAGKYTGTVLICGSAPCIHDDYAAARANRPDAAVIAVNEAAQVVWADFIVSVHNEQLEGFRAKSLNKQALTLSGGRIREGAVFDCWFSQCNSGGTSAGSAIRIAKKMGFTEIILCGCPITGGDGYFNRPYAPQKLLPTRVGLHSKDANAIRIHQSNLAKEAAASDYSMVRSLSGFTKELFGGPEWLQASA